MTQALVVRYEEEIRLLRVQLEVRDFIIDQLQGDVEELNEILGDIQLDKAP